MYKLNRVGVASLAVLLTYNAYAAGGYVCDNLKMYTGCDTGYYMTNASGVYNPMAVAGNDCTACPTDAIYCHGGTYAPLYQVTLDPNGGLKPVSGWDSLFVYVSPDSSTGPNSLVCDNSVISGDDYGPCFSGGTMSALDSSYLPTRDRYNFAGFSTTKDATVANAVSADGTINTRVLATNSPLTLYAVWELAVCDPNQYLESGECKSCPDSYPNSVGGGGGQDSCYLITEPGKYVAESQMAQVPCDSGYYCEGGETVYYNSTSARHESCPVNYDDGGTGLSAIGECTWNVPAGSYIKNAKDTTATACVSGEWKDEHSVRYGDVSVANKCTPLDGMAAASKAPFNSEETCYISASTTLNDGKGSYIFTEDCNYTEGAN